MILINEYGNCLMSPVFQLLQYFCIHWWWTACFPSIQDVTCCWGNLKYDLLGNLESFTVSLHSSTGCHYGCARGLSLAYEKRSQEPTIHWDWGNSNLYLDQPNKWMMPTDWGHILYSAKSLNDTGLGLCSSLWTVQHHWRLLLLIFMPRLLKWWLV